MGGGAHRNFDSNGPDIKIRGTANHIFDRYCQLARDANSSGDRVGAENYLQHAEHYFRIMLANGLLQQQQQPRPQGNGQQPNQNGNGQQAYGEGEGGEQDGEGDSGPENQSDEAAIQER